MSTDAVKIARLENERELRRQLIALLTHPVFSLVAGYILVEYFERKGIIGDKAATAVEGGLISATFLQGIGGQSGLDSILKLVPVLAPLLIK